METLTQTVASVCMIAVGLSFAECIIPMERFSKQIRWLFTLLLFIGILRPWLNADVWDAAELPTDSETSSYADELQSTADTLLTESIAAQMKNTLNTALTEHNVNAEILTIDVHIAEDGSIDIKRITVTGNLLTATVYLREWLGDGTEISAHETEESE